MGQADDAEQRGALALAERSAVPAAVEEGRHIEERAEEVALADDASDALAIALCHLFCTRVTAAAAANVEHKRDSRKQDSHKVDSRMRAGAK